jgi:hypothetical protein
MQIREGAYYRTRGGNVVGPMKHVDYHAEKWKFWAVGFNDGVPSWTDDGRWCEFDDSHDMNLISEVYVSDTPPADGANKFQSCAVGTYAPETIRLDPRTEWKLFRQMGPHELVTNASVPMLETKTLRDEFAGYAIIGLLAAGDCHAFNRDEMAVEAYRQADAMMEARMK